MMNEQRIELAELTTVATRVQADLIEALLGGAGIPCEVRPPPGRDADEGGWYAGGRYGVITIRVRPEDLEPAREAIAGLR